jgi:ATP-dependent Clp protease, protease subunit
MAKDKDTASFLHLDDKIDNEILMRRRVFLCQDVSSESAQDIIRKLWFLDFNEPGKPILMIINSPGGAVDAGFAIWDQVKMLTSPVYTLVTGLAASMGSILSLCAGPKKRFATPNSRIMIHQPLISGVLQGQATDLDIQAKEMIKTRSALVKIYVDATGKGAEEIEKAIDRDTWMTAAEAKEFGLLDNIVESADDLEKYFKH